MKLILRMGWQKLADYYGLKIEHWGLPALTGFSFQSDNALAYKTLITQEMLKKGFLASTNFYACIKHTDENFNLYFDALDTIYKSIKNCETGHNDIEKLLEGPVCHSGFKRLN